MIDGAPRNGSGATVPVAIVCKSLNASAGYRYCRNRAKPSVETATVLIPTQWRGRLWTIIATLEREAGRVLPSSLDYRKERTMKPEVNGTPTYELAETGRHDLASMLACCAAEADSYWRQPEGERQCAAPYYFERAAILLRKAKDYSGEIDICERWKAIANDYKRQPMVKARLAALAHKGAASRGDSGAAEEGQRAATEGKGCEEEKPSRLGLGFDGH